MCVDTCVDVCVGMCADTRVEPCADMNVDMCVGMGADMCATKWRTCTWESVPTPAPAISSMAIASFIRLWACGLTMLATVHIIDARAAMPGAQTKPSV